MIKTALYIIAGLLLGLIIHLIIILSLPHVAPNNIYNAFTKLSAPGELIILKRPKQMEENFLRLDPELIYAICQYDLSLGPGTLNGVLPNDFWSIGVFDKTGVAIYSTTNRSGGGQELDLGIFNPAQTRLLAEHQIELNPNTLVVKASTNEVFAVVRLASPHPAMQHRYEEIIKKLKCGNIN